MKTAPSTKCAVVWRNWAAMVMCIAASLAMIGDIAGSRILKGLGVASAMAPMPKVFCQYQGLEGFACEFLVRFEVAGREQLLPITPDLYAQLAGPYNRRNVYGAALAAGPKLPRGLWEPVFVYGFGERGPLRREFGIPPEATNVAVIVRSRTGSGGEWLLKPGTTP